MKYYLIFALSLLGTNALASQSWVNARSYSSNNCGYATTVLADFQITYKNEQLPWGTQIILHTGFHESYRDVYWTHPENTLMNAVDSYQWQARLNQETISARGNFHYNFIEFVFEIILPDGSRNFDNAGRGTYGHYGSPLRMGLNCLPAEFRALPVWTLEARDPGEQAHD